MIKLPESREAEACPPAVSAVARLIWMLLFILTGGLGLVHPCYSRAIADENNACFPVDLDLAASYQHREIRVNLLGDQDLSRRPEAATEVESALREVSAEFKRLFGLSFIPVGWSSWETDKGSRNVQELAENLDRRGVQVKDRRAEITMAVTGRSNLRPEYSGLTLFKSSMIIIVYTPDRVRLRRLIRHELGHIFGAVHVPESQSVMSCSGEGGHFDAYNQEIINLTRERSFEPFVFPYPPEIQARAERIYLKVRENIKKVSHIRSLFSASPSGETGPETQCLSDVFLMLAQLELEQNDYERAAGFCEEALILNPGDLEAMNLQAISLRQAGRTQEAIHLYQLILNIKPDFSEALYNLGIALGELNRFDEAEKVYLRAIRLNPYLAQAHHNLGDLYFRQGRLDEAEEQFLKAIELSPGYTSAYLNLGEIYRRKRDIAKARECVEKALSLQPESVQARNLLGNILRESGKSTEALNEYQQVLARNPSSVQAYYNLGVSLTDLGRWEEARQAFEQAVKIDINMAEAYGGLGLCHLHRGEMDEAIKFLLKARELGFKNPALSINLSYAYMNIKDWQRAEEEASRAVADQPGLSLGYNNMGIALAQQNKFEEARIILEKALKVDPRDREAVINLAMVELSLQNEERALELFLRALALNPEDSQNGLICNNIAVIYFHQENYELSWEFIQKALKAGFKVDGTMLGSLIKKLK
ncbi:MAG TPA: tetratricopeptide repeat protein [Candidatus Saccharicenans sp.]|jgi:tetratricopeptide (TPR) repeat protein|nr:tetratricopeptide repeat protein [Candidatus Saccharicenans sp.]HRD01068.1 tetratricopeptide repeat protein [Candidatus Saccharicenans sp.]